MGEPARDLLDRRVISFGPFQLWIAERRLLKDDVPLAVSSRSLDILIALVERAGEVVGKKELVARVWPDVIVGESSLRVYVAALRKALGDGRDGMRYIANVPGRGYSFVAPITLTPRDTAPPTEHLSKLPPKLLRMIDRQETIERVCAQLLEHPFVTIVGPGGMGKTTVGVAVAHALVREFAGAVFFVDLASVAVPSLVAEAVGSAMGFPTRTDEPVSSLIAYLEQRRLMLVLDNCEHLIESVAVLAERICRAAPRVHILATSRESLRAEGEYVYELPRLEVPPEDSALTAAEALAFPAVRLFVERATADGNRIELNDADARVVAGICRRLDGIALALELAAGSVRAHGICGTAELLEQRFGLLWQGRRTALPRHRTLNALLDWSYNLLAEHEQRVLRRLSIFAGGFTLEAAQAVGADTNATTQEVFEALTNLVNKSLVYSQIGESLAQIPAAPYDEGLCIDEARGEWRGATRCRAARCIFGEILRGCEPCGTSRR